MLDIFQDKPEFAIQQLLVDINFLQVSKMVIITKLDSWNPLESFFYLNLADYAGAVIAVCSFIFYTDIVLNENDVLYE